MKKNPKTFNIFYSETFLGLCKTKMSHIEDKKKQVVDAINYVALHLRSYLPLANAHMTDFIVKDWWNKKLSVSIKESLLKLNKSDLTLLPSGKLFNLDVNCEKGALSKENSHGCDHLVISGEKDSVLEGERPKWNPEISPDWKHSSLKKFVEACQERSLQYIGILTPIEELFGGDYPADSTPITEFMSVKKSHEVEIMTEICAHVARKFQISHVIDIGSGKGYLGSHLAFKHQLNVLGIDSSSTNTDGATGRSQRLGKQWDGLVKKSKQSKGVDVERNTTLEGENQKHEKGVFVPVTQYVSGDTDIQHLLHNAFNGSTSSKPSGPKAADVTVNLDNKSYAEDPILKPDCIKYMITGLHACGDLTPNSIRLFLQNKEAQILCNVGCCYHHLTEAYIQCPFGRGDNLDIEETGFPMSQYLRSRGCQLGRNARMLASQAPDRVAEIGKPPSPSLFWRALLQVILRDLTAETRDDWQVGKIASKCSDFKTYANKALDKLRFEKLTDVQIASYESRYELHEAQVQSFVQLKAALAPCIETLILLDRMCFLLEQDCIQDVHLTQAFDPVTSPRCYALIARKKDTAFSIM